MSESKTEDIIIPPKEMTRSDLFITEDHPALPYSNWNKCNAVHYGQMKLFFVDLQFLNLFINYNRVPNPVLLVIGAAPGQHFPMLVKMFPRLKLHLYDPREFHIRHDEMERITIHRKLFTLEEAELWKDRDDVFLISDIRVVTESGKESREEWERQTTEDMNLQQDIVLAINPLASSLKFRLPYVNPKEDGTMDDKIVEYLDGFVFKQPWQKLNTNESRLFSMKTNGIYRKRKWSSIKYQDQCYFHNRYIRCSNFYNPFTGDVTPVYGEDLTNDFDSIATMFILRDYCVKMEKVEPSQEKCLALYRVIVDDINRNRSRRLEVSQLRGSKWKTSTRNTEHSGYQEPVSIIRPLSLLISTISENDTPVAPQPIEILV